MMRMYRLITLGCAVVFAVAAYGDPLTLYVAPNGNDAWTGTLDAPTADNSNGPFATITGARDAIRKLKTAGPLPGPVSVLVRAGTYAIKEAIVFTPDDSGTITTPITFAAYPNEKPIISGGTRITNWRQEGNLWITDLPDVKAGTWHFSALWVDGKYEARAHTPNEGFLRTAGKAPELKDATSGQTVDRTKTSFLFNPGEIQAWKNPDDVSIITYFAWDVAYNRVGSIDDANHVVTFKQPTSWPIENWGPKQRYVIDNVREGLDAPGEWYLDRADGTLTYFPKNGEKPDSTEIIAPRTDHLLTLEGHAADGKYVAYLTFRGLAFSHTNFEIPKEGQPDFQAAYPVPGAVEGIGARFCTIENCDVSHISNYAIWLHSGCQDNLVQHNHIHDMGAGGVRIGEGGDPASEKEAAYGNVIDNNWIHDGGKVYPAAVGVWIGRSSFNQVSHNEISDLFYTGISVGWSWGYAPSSANHNIIEYNHIHDIGKYVLSDMGGIYLLGIAPGTTLQYNHIHDIYSFSYGGWGIYPDEGSSDLLIQYNVVHDTKTGGFHQHYGKENRVRNNIFAFAKEAQVIRTREEDHISFFFEHNIVYFDNGKLLGSNWKNGNFRTDYNCFFDTSKPTIDFAGKTFADWQATGQDVHSLIVDPLFRDAEDRDFRLESNSPAITKLGFQSLDAHQAGLYGERDWVRGPKHVTRAPYSQPVEP